MASSTDGWEHSGNEPFEPLLVQWGHPPMIASSVTAASSAFAAFSATVASAASAAFVAFAAFAASVVIASVAELTTCAHGPL